MKPIKHIPSFSKFGDQSVNIITHSIDVTVGVRRLRAIWTPELAHDLSAFHNIDAETELTTLLSEHVATEIDRQILQELINPNEVRRYGPGILNDLIPVQPLSLPMGHLFYFDTRYSTPITFDDGSWCLGNIFESVIGANMELKQHQFI